MHCTPIFILDLSLKPSQSACFSKLPPSRKYRFEFQNINKLDFKKIQLLQVFFFTILLQIIDMLYTSIPKASKIEWEIQVQDTLPHSDVQEKKFTSSIQRRALGIKRSSCHVLSLQFQQKYISNLTSPVINMFVNVFFFVFFSHTLIPPSHF